MKVAVRCGWIYHSTASATNRCWVLYLLLPLLAAAPSRSNAQAWGTMNIPGGWDGFNPSNTVGPFRMTTVPPPGTPDGAYWYTNVMYVAASGGDVTNGSYQFKLAADGAWTYNWGGAAVNIDNTTALAPDSASNATITVTNGYYYSFRTLNPPTNATATLAVMKTSARPVSVAFAGLSPAAPRTNDTVTVNITLGAAKSPEENIYVRWTTNGFATSSFSQASGSGTSYSATIPAMTNEATTVIYYILSSTATPAGGLTSNPDALTLNLDSNGGNNYTYTTYSMPWPGFGYPSDPATNIYHWKEEAVVGNGYINAMLDQNGALFDLYYPSVGDRHGVGTSNEGYRGPESWPNENSGDNPYVPCTNLDEEADGQMNMIAGMGGIAIGADGTNSIYWLKNTNGTDYANVGQQWDSDSVNVVLTSNQLVAAGNNIQVMQYDFCPSISALPIVTDGTRTNYGVYIKRFLLTNNQATTNTIDFYYDANFNVNGGNTNNFMYWETTVAGTNYDAMVVFNTNYVDVSTSDTGCLPNGYGIPYSPSFAFDWTKNSSIYFATVMKLITNTVSGAGLPADGSWRDHTATDNQEGWIGKRITLPPGVTNEVDVMIVGSWDDFAGATGTYDFWGRPMITWFYTNNMATAQAATETYWSNWLSAGVTVDFPSTAYNTLFKRSLLITALHQDAVTGAIMAGMHNGAYPFVWPRDGVYAAVTLDRTAHTNEAANFYHWLQDVAYRNPDQNPGGKSFFFQKYTTDGYYVWTAAQIDETATVPWGLYYHYLITGEGSFVTNYYPLALQAAFASYYSSTNDSNAYYDFATNLMHGENVWEDSNDEFLYSNAAIVRGLRDAANLAAMVGDTSNGPTWTAQTGYITGGLTNRINSHYEPADISQLGMAVPFEVFEPNNPLMTNVVEWIYGRQAVGTCAACESAGGPWKDNLIETDNVNYAFIVGLVNRYAHNVNGDTDDYWNTSPGAYLHSPWFLASSWLGEYFARWQDYVGGTSLVDTNKNMLDLLVAKLGPMGLAAEQIAPTPALQLYPGFWLQTAWPNTWESHSTLVDQMMMFLDYKPEGTNGNNTAYFAPKVPSAWSTMTYNNLDSQGQRFDITITENAQNVRAYINKHTVGALNVDTYLRIPAGVTPVMVVTNGAYYVPSPSEVDTNTGRVHIQGPLTSAAVDNYIVVTYGTNSYTGDGIADSWALHYGFNPLDPTVANQDSDGTGFSNLQKYLAGFNPTNSAAYLHIISIVNSNPNVIVTYLGASGDNTYSPGIASRTNVLEFTTGNANGGYTNDFASAGQTNILSGGNGLGTVTNMTDFGGATNRPSRYYRVRVLLP
jgi:GH15 family glucan-1,4-alpha-glucosidase